MKIKTLLAIVLILSLIFAVATVESFAQSNGVYVALSGGAHGTLYNANLK